MMNTSQLLYYGILNNKYEETLEIVRWFSKFLLDEIIFDHWGDY